MIQLKQKDQWKNNAGREIVLQIRHVKRIPCCQMLSDKSKVSSSVCSSVVRLINVHKICAALFKDDTQLENVTIIRINSLWKIGITSSTLKVEFYLDSLLKWVGAKKESHKKSGRI